MIIGGIAGLFDIFGIFDVARDYAAFVNTGVLPQSDIGRDFFIEIIKGAFILLISVLIFGWGYFDRRKSP
jgi:hypothetical protein